MFAYIQNYYLFINMKKFTQNLTSLVVLCALFLIGCTNDLEKELDELVAEDTTTETSNHSNQRSGGYLDYGLHWFNANNVATKAYNEQTNQVIPVSSSYYNPSKPTVIYFHGWQNGSAQRGYDREDFRLENSSENVDKNTISKWKQDGWNVAIFYWNQFADEGEVKDAEAKIWSANGPRGMRYRQSDGSYQTALAPNKSLGELAFDQFKAVVGGNTSNNIRLVGHSLGNQFATNVAKRISDAVQNGQLPSRLMPNRLELLDPFWSKGGKSYLGDSNGDGNNDWTGERVRWSISEMVNRNNLAVTWYKSSLILTVGVGDGNNALKDIVTLQSVRYWYLNAFQVADKHVYVRLSYFWSYESAPPEEVTINFWGSRKKTGKVAASASTSTSRIRQMMGDRYVWDQVEGRYTVDPADDQFEIKNW